MVSLPVAIAAIVFSSAGQTVLLDFYGDYCPPCRAMQPTVQALIDAGYPVKRVNAEHSPLAAQYGVTRWPCFIMLVNGQEVDRVVGSTTYSRLERMCKISLPAPAPQAPPAMLAQNIPPVAAPPSPPPSPLAAPFDGWNNQPMANQPVAAPAPAPAGVSDAALIAASVRIRVEDADGHSCGSGTIVDARQGEALILTCGHLFRDYKPNRRIEVDLLGPAGPQRVAGRLVSYSVPDVSGAEANLKPDLGLVAIQTPGPVASARVAPPGYQVQPGMAVVSVGCNNGEAPSARRSYVTSLDKFVGSPNVQVAGQPVEGRSGGGLFSSEGYVIGVCNAADPSDKEGLFAALGSIWAELDRKDSKGRDLSFVYKSPGENRGGTTPEASGLASNPAAVAAAAAPPIPNRTAAPASLASWNSISDPASEAPSALPPHEQAALDEMHRRMKEGSDVTIVVHARNDPDAKSEVFMLEHASREFVGQLAAEARRRETSLEVPKPQKPRQILLEWSAADENAEAQRQPAAMMDANPRIGPSGMFTR